MYINKIQFVIIEGASIVKEATLLTVQQINQLAMELCISVFGLLLSRGEIKPTYFNVQFSLSRIWLFATPWTAAHQASLSFTISQSLFKLMSIESVIPSNHLILCRPLLLLSSIMVYNLLIGCWIQFASISLRIFASIFLKDIGM